MIEDSHTEFVISVLRTMERTQQAFGGSADPDTELIFGDRATI